MESRHDRLPRDIHKRQVKDAAALLVEQQPLLVQCKRQPDHRSGIPFEHVAAQLFLGGLKLLFRGFEPGERRIGFPLLRGEIALGFGSGVGGGRNRLLAPVELGLDAGVVVDGFQHRLSRIGDLALRVAHLHLAPGGELAVLLGSAARLGELPLGGAQPAAREREVALESLGPGADLGQPGQFRFERRTHIGQFIALCGKLLPGPGELSAGILELLLPLLDGLPRVGKLLLADRIVRVQRRKIAGDRLQAVAHAFKFGLSLLALHAGKRPLADLLLKLLLQRLRSQCARVLGMELELVFEQFGLGQRLRQLFGKRFQLRLARLGEPLARLRLPQLFAHVFELRTAAAQLVEDDRRRPAVEQRPLSHMAGLAVRRHTDQHRQHGRHEEVAHDDEDRTIHFSSPPEQSSFLRSG